MTFSRAEKRELVKQREITIQRHIAIAKVTLKELKKDINRFISNMQKKKKWSKISNRFSKEWDITVFGTSGVSAIDRSFSQEDVWRS